MHPTDRMIPSSETAVGGPLRALLAGAIDYAGLFPPAGLAMAEAVANFAAYRQAPHAWALGRFVLPAGRLDEFAAAAGQRDAGPCRLSALMGADFASDLAKVDRFNQLHARLATVDTLELKAGAPESIGEALRVAGGRYLVFHEIPQAGDPQPFLEALAQAGGRAKVRTGGVTPEAIPEPASLARFLRQCAAARVPFKATAGLHHPIRGPHRLTYEPAAPTAVMHGFVNVFLAAAFARAGWGADGLTALLGEQSPLAFSFEADGLSWHGHRMAAADLEATRAEFLSSFGSCSFEEPIGDLQTLGWLPA
jgi:hypothetical protein